MELLLPALLNARANSWEPDLNVKRGKVVTFLQCTWCVLAAAVLVEGIYVVTAYPESSRLKSDALFGTYAQMWVINAPLGFVISGVAADVADSAGIALFDVNSGTFRLVLSWTIACLPGALQWFLIFPTTVRWIRRAAQFLGNRTKQRELSESSARTKGPEVIKRGPNKGAGGN